MLYGIEALCPSLDVEAPILISSTRRALSYIRDATVDSFFATRATSVGYTPAYGTG